MANVKVKQSLTERLDILWDWLDETRRIYGIPGLAATVVRRDAILGMKGFGISCAQPEEKITADTVFGIASLTKPLITTVLAKLTNQQTFTWNDPIQDHLSEFQLNDEPEAGITIQNCLSHSTGRANMGLLYSGNTLTRSHLLELAFQAKPLVQPAQTFIYNNVFFTAGVEACARALGNPIEVLLKEELLRPLGMERTGLSTAAPCPEGRGHVTHTGEQVALLDVLNRYAMITPAGGGWSTVQDLSRWLLLLLNEGIIDGRRIVEPETLAHLWSPIIATGSGQAYGLGWQILDWQNTKVLMHSGGVDGFSSLVTVLPEINIGFAVLTNLGPHVFPNAGWNVICEILAGEEKPSGLDRKPVSDLRKRTGRYLVDFPPHEMTEARVHSRQHALLIEIPGFPLQRLIPTEQVDRFKLPFAAGDFVSFRLGQDGTCEELQLTHGGFVLNLPRCEPSEPAPSKPSDEIRPWKGVYRRAGVGNYKVISHRGRPAVHVPGQMIYQLDEPDEALRRPFRSIPDQIQITFKRTIFGNRHLKLFQNGKCHVFKKIGNDPQLDLPCIAEIRKSIRKSTFGDERQTPERLVLHGRCERPHQGISGRIHANIVANHTFDIKIDFAELGCYRISASKSRGEIEDMRGTKRTYGPESLNKIWWHHPFWFLADWTSRCEHMLIAYRDWLGEEPVWTVRIKPPGWHGRVFHVSQTTGRVLLETFSEPDPESSLFLVQTRSFEDYQKFGSYTFPSRITVNDPVTGSGITHWESIEAS